MATAMTTLPSPLTQVSQKAPADLDQWASIRTLASLSMEDKASKCTASVAGDIESVVVSDRNGVALLVASSPSHELDRAQQPNPLVELGGVTMVNHALYQLNSAAFRQVIVVVGFRGDDVRKQIDQCLSGERDLFAGLTVEFIDLGKGWRGGRVASIAKARVQCEQLMEKHDESLVIIGADHMFDRAVLQEAANLDLLDCGDEACVLVETDLEGMVGLPPSTVFCAMRPLHGADRIYNIGTDIETYSAIEAGLIVFTRDTMKLLEDAYKEEDYKGSQMHLLLAKIAKRGTLRMMKTNGRTWFSMETSASIEYTSEGLRTNGLEYTLANGSKVHLIGLPSKLETSPVDGGEWAAFNVAKWRSAVYTAQSFFQELFVDTTEFIAKLCEEKGGRENALVVEVGCGTGEALVPLFEHAKYTVGMDFNAHFIEFCRENVAPEWQPQVRHLIGDAQELVTLLTNELPETWMSRPKIVTCVGNTMGIIPAEIRKNVYQQMKLLAGQDGYVVIVFWNGNRFGDAVQNFYHNNPQLCGPFKGECIDLDTCTLTTPSGYCTHWTKPEEARTIFERDIGLEVTQLLEKGNGVLVAGRQRNVSPA